MRLRIAHPLKWAVLSLRALCSALLLLWLAFPRDPYLLAWRHLEVDVQVLLGLCLLSWAVLPLLAGRKNCYSWLWLSLALLGLAGAFYHEAQIAWQKRLPEFTDSQVLRVLGQHIMVGFTDPQQIEPLIRSGAVGGIFITRRNVQGQSPAQIRQHLQHWQTQRAQQGLPPLWISTDQEGGLVSRMSPPLPWQPSLALVAQAADSTERQRLAYQYGVQQGTGLAALGINWNFSPMLDLLLPQTPNPLDLHSKISQRAIHQNPDRVAEVAVAYAQGLLSAKVVATGKHFPGLGRTRSDTHHFRVDLDTSRTQLAHSDWIPFRQFVQHTPATLMLSHVVLRDVDATLPVSQSKRVIGMLRNEWGYQGVLITDDLTMGAAYRARGGICAAAVRGLNAEVDVLLISFDGEQVYRVLACLLAAHQEGRLDVAALQRSALRLQRLRTLVQ